MSIIPQRIVERLKELRATLDEPRVRQRLTEGSGEPNRPALRSPRRVTAASIEALWQKIRAVAPAGDEQQRLLADPDTLASAECYGANIENMIGTVKVPVGVAGPVRINGLNAAGDFVIPLATSEAALVASYARGADIASRAGGIAAVLLTEGVLRSPGFKFANVMEAGLFLEWVIDASAELKVAAEATTRHGKLCAIEPMMDNEVVFLLCRYTTGDASGQNMVTIATEALCRHIETHCPVRPRHWFIEANYSGDKKSTYLALTSGRGRKVTASVTLPRALVEKYLHVSVERFLDYSRMASLGAMLSGQIGAQGHFANGLAAFYIATGQDAACVSESAIGFTRVEDRDGDLFISVTLPNILVGSVGGGTGLPSQAAALHLLGLQGPGKAAALAEVVAALCLCGEISIIGALAAGEFTQAHRKLARER
ncbi:hydroxymethylglutaryl-CoA reductase [Halomonas salipaludis]|uniref:hydroxymethylglutaryl-CoA reductase (NADPH) n=1 Tax=Halomonas salipaludis TaxID=2032625 RepID=A0A2A2F137_9GAMM|nr:hydroxymethylglutaryl-CoA reductase [Halomonas salipaludis]PAU78480.1 3-hydroxy-3-methylglutaryl-CoA reductase [Halomonas salipaludis]